MAHQSVRSILPVTAGSVDLRGLCGDATFLEPAGRRSALPSELTMCGVAGMLSFDSSGPNRDVVERMLNDLAHRGPDGSGIWVDGAVALGHVRLSILDLTDSAAQPMESTTGRTVVTYNGEVYNFADLRTELGDVRLASSGDTAVVVEYIERFGIVRFVERAEGFFAIGSWDREAQTLTLARDRHGIKPLFVRESPSQLMFASEMTPLAAGLEPDAVAVAAMLAGRSPTSGTRTLFTGMRSVLAGEILVIEQSTRRIRSQRPFRPRDFYDPDLSARLATADDETLVGAFEQALRKSIRLRMTSDAPVACLASGGIDSSLVAAIAKDEGFELPLYHADVVARTERPAAEALAAHLGADLIVESTTDDDIVAAIAAVTAANELPLTYHINAIPFYLLSRRVSQDGVKVILTGEGADEYLLGYPQYGVDWAIRLLERVRAPMRRSVRSRTALMADRIWYDPRSSMNSMVVDILAGMDKHVQDVGIDVSHLESRERDSLVHSLGLVEGHLLSTLHRNDRLGMAWGLECRFPFLGYDLARVCLSSPARQRMRWSRRVGDRRHPFVVDKWVVRECARRWLPTDLVERPKLGFPVTIWDRANVRMDSLVDSHFAQMFSLGPAELEAIATNAGSKMAFRCLLTEIWLRTTVHRASPADVEAFVDKAIVR